MPVKKGLQLPPDFLAKTAHLSTPESGAYLNLLLAYWERKSPLPDDDEYLARAARATRKNGVRWTVIKPNVMAMFQKRHNCWTSDFVENQILNLYSSIATASNKAKKRWDRQKWSLSTTHIEENQSLNSCCGINLSPGQISYLAKENYPTDRSVTLENEKNLTATTLKSSDAAIIITDSCIPNRTPSIRTPRSQTPKHQIGTPSLRTPKHQHKDSLSDSSCFSLTGETLRILKDGTEKKLGISSSLAGAPETDLFGTKNSKQKTSPLPPSTVVASSAADDPETQLFRRGKEVLGPKSGGMIARLLKSRGGNISLARAAIETASTKENPAEYIGAICRNANLSHKEERERQMRRERGEAW